MAMYGKKMGSGMKKGAMSKFKPCRGCPTPKECARAGRCKAKTRMK
jgi:hypothetical protein